MHFFNSESNFVRVGKNKFVLKNSLFKKVKNKLLKDNAEMENRKFNKVRWNLESEC